MRRRANLTMCLLFVAATVSGMVRISSAGYLVAWGNNEYGACDVPIGGDFVAIAAGGECLGGHNIAIRLDGSLVAWGRNDYGQCDVPDGNNFVDIAAGYYFSIALKSDGTLASWGWNYYSIDVPKGNDFVAIAAGPGHCLALRSNGSIVGWGSNIYGESNAPQGHFVAIAAGGAHSVALRSNGSLIAWGYNGFGIRNVPAGYDFIDIAGYHDFAAALKSDGSIVAWGDNRYGQCNVPEGKGFVDIACGTYHGLALKEDGSLVAWGSNSYGQRNVPKAKSFVAIACGYEHSLALDLERFRKYYVDANATGLNDGSSWLNAYHFLQDALSIASNGDEVLVAKGIYKPDRDSRRPYGSGDRSVKFQLADGVTIKGGYAGYGEPDPNARNINFYKTTLSGDLNGDDGPNFTNNLENSYHVVYCDGAQSASILDGLTITGGNANSTSGGKVSNREGGGIQCYRSSPSIINCIIIGNSAGGTWSFGGGIHNYISSPKLINCLISRNSAGRYGGAMYNNLDSITKLVNCTVVDNWAETNGGGLANYNRSQSVLTNCILWNIGNEILNSDNSMITITYSDVQGGWLGEGNIDADPCFVDAANGDYHLLPDSPCIDTGEKNSIPADFADLDGDGDVNEPIPFDLDGNPRVVYDFVDMGAYEFFNTPPISDAGPDQVVECACNTEGGTKVILDGTGSYDADGDPLTYTWTGPFVESPVQGATPTVTLEDGCPGEYVITLVVNDGIDDSEPNEVVITVVDTTPPEFALSVSPIVLWPPNHEMIKITPSWTVSDECDTSPDVSLVSIGMNEDDNSKSDGNTNDDIEIGDDGTIYLRAERDGTGNCRIYTITYQAVDDSGNVTVRSTIVVVPHELKSLERIGYRWLWRNHTGEESAKP